MELINNTAELRQVVTVSSDLILDRYKPHLQSAETLLINQVGRAVVKRIKDANAPTDLEKELRQLFRRVVGNLALYKYAQVSNVDISNIGIQRTKSENTSDAFEWQVDRLTRQMEADGIEALEETIGFLDEHADTFTEYEAVDTNRLIRTAALYSSFVHIRKSRIVFRALEPSLATVEATYRRIPAIRQFISDYRATTTPSDEQKERMEALQRSLANSAMVKALKTQTVELTGEGVQVRAVSQVLTLNYRTGPNKDLLNNAIAEHEKEAKLWLDTVQIDLRPSDTISPTGGPRGKAIVSF